MVTSVGWSVVLREEGKREERKEEGRMGIDVWDLGVLIGAITRGLGRNLGGKEGEQARVMGNLGGFV